MKAHASLIKAPAILYDALCLVSNSHGSERANSIAAIKESVSAIEAFMNELGELGYGYESHGHAESNPIVLLGKRLREAEQNRKSIKHKVQTACESLSGKRMSKGGLPSYQKFSLVVDVRNELSHPKASVLTIGDGELLPPKKEQRMIKRLRSYGFVCGNASAHDWVSAVDNAKFAHWAHLAIVEMMIYVLYLWPHRHAIDSFMEMYGLNNYVRKENA